MITWPPDYTIRKHRLTKNVKLIASKKQGLVISVPLRFSMRKITALLEENKSWIVDQILKWKPTQPIALPERILLQAMGETWRVSYQSCVSQLQLIERPQQEIVVLGQPQLLDPCRKILMKWVRNKASDFLKTKLDQISHDLGFEYKKVMIRDQSTRWGSCNAKKHINLNYKLVFLPHHLMRHILIHELCHTVYLNHSLRFWQLVARFDPDYLASRKAIRTANQYIPDWL